MNHRCKTHPDHFYTKCECGCEYCAEYWKSCPRCFEREHGFHAFRENLRTADADEPDTFSDEHTWRHKEDAKMKTHNLTAALEELVDASSVHAVLLDLAFICHEKADHIRANYNALGEDRELIKAWTKAGKICDVAQAKVEV